MLGVYVIGTIDCDHAQPCQTYVHPIASQREICETDACYRFAERRLDNADSGVAWRGEFTGSRGSGCLSVHGPLTLSPDRQTVGGGVNDA